MNYRTVGPTSFTLAALLVPGHAGAEERGEITRTVSSFAARECPLTPPHALDAEVAETKEIVPFLGAILAGIAGTVVQQGLTAAGDALEAASKEKGIVAEAATTFPVSRLQLAGAGSPVARTEPLANCLVLFSPGTEPIEDLPSDPKIVEFGKSAAGLGQPLALFDPNFQAQRIAALRARGVTTIPSLYVELQLITFGEGMRLRPALVWYRNRLSKAPSGTSDAELHATLATPGAGTSAGDIGTIFAGARMMLPRVKPGDFLDWTRLGTATSVTVPLRPTAGYVDGRVAAANTAYTTLATKKKEERVAQRAAATAVRKHNAKPTTDTAEAVVTTAETYTNAMEEHTLAGDQVDALQESNLGWTNSKLRFVVIRDANQFGLALAKALKGQAEAAGKAVTGELTPKPDWMAGNTAYLTAKTELDAKQREYDAALLANDSALIAKLGDELILKKAKLNEAAVAINRPLPYPSLLD